MESEKNSVGLLAATGGPCPSRPPNPRRAVVRRSRGPWRIGLACLACLAFIAYAQWRLLRSVQPQTRPGLTAYGLSVARVEEGLETCAALHTRPRDPVGPGRSRSARYVEGHRPTLIRNATVWTGEPTTSSSGGTGYAWTTADVFLEHGLIRSVAATILLAALPQGGNDVLVYDARGRPLTAGLIDMHSHAGVHGLPTLKGNEDVSELSSDITPYVRSLDGIQPTDHQLQVIKSGGVTTSLVLPGSSNNIGGEAFVIKHAVGRTDGRNETSLRDLLADPPTSSSSTTTTTGAIKWRHMKMGCGENAKDVHGKVGERGPLSRLGEGWAFRQAFERASTLRRAQDDWCRAAAADRHRVRTYLPEEREWDALVAVLRGQVHVHVHCYTVPDLESFVGHTNEFRFPVRAFHHAHQSYLVPEVLKRAWGGDPPASALFADNMWYKAESYIGSEYAGKHLYDSNLTVVYVSDNPILNAQHLAFEAAKAFRYGLPYHAAMASITTAPAESLGLGQQLGKVKPGFDADLVVWDSDPLSVGATPVQVWIDGTAQYEHPVELTKPFGGVTVVPDAEGRSVPNEEPMTTTGGLVVFTGIVRDLFSAPSPSSTNGGDTSDAAAAAAAAAAVIVVVVAGRITCIGQCTAEVQEASASGSAVTVHLTNGYLTPAYTAFGSTLGLNAIESEPDTDNGADGDVFSRGIDGLTLGTEKLRVAHRYAVTRAVSAPKFAGINTHHGTSVGFRTRAVTSLEAGAVFASDAAVHYTLDLSAKGGGRTGVPPTSLSAAVGTLRRKLLAAVADASAGPATAEHDDAYDAEVAFLRRVVAGNMTLCITAHSADTIAALLRVKADVDAALSAREHRLAQQNKPAGRRRPAVLRLVVVGGAEAHLLAHELADVGVGVVLAPLFAFGTTWDQRRALTGAPLTNGTGVDVLLEAGVLVAAGLEEDWVVRDLGLLAGIVYANSGGRLSERAAVDIVSRNIHTMLGLDDEHEPAHFALYEGSPFEMGSRVKAVGGGDGRIELY
ncbi:amidohydrolase [Niveomyces insectorum RCEF 264]|uniref:Amidohydrolase n=1 Tax=Niveomyces insectorum RCEF 264 TaxID=1081102 RepID=A0A168AB38_9HYPO|nr:amidohydrolase [Niveomyces insectorum RCEF 264]